MAEPTYEDLTQSIVEAGAWEGLTIAVEGGVLRIIERDGVALTPPVSLEFNADALLAYYRGIAASARSRPQSPWEWWMDVMSTHLGEAMYEMDRADRPCVLTIGESGFTATPVATGRGIC